MFKKLTKRGITVAIAATLATSGLVALGAAPAQAVPSCLQVTTSSSGGSATYSWEIKRALNACGGGTTVRAKWRYTTGASSYTDSCFSLGPYGTNYSKKAESGMGSRTTISVVDC